MKKLSAAILACRFPVGLWRSWERASMAWKRSGVRTSPGPPNLFSALHRFFPRARYPFPSHFLLLRDSVHLHQPVEHGVHLGSLTTSVRERVEQRHVYGVLSGRSHCL